MDHEIHVPHFEKLIHFVSQPKGVICFNEPGEDKQKTYYDPEEPDNIFHVRWTVEKLTIDQLLKTNQP